MRPELIALDLDGTLLPESKRLSVRTIAAVRRVGEAGSRVVLATGKTSGLAARYAIELGLDTPLIALNGGLVRESPEGAVLSESALDPARAREVAELTRDLALRPYLADGGDRLLVHEELRPWGPYLSAYSARMEFSPAPLSKIRGGAYFLAMLGAAAEVARGRERLRPLEGGADGLEVFQASFHRTGDATLVVRPAATKGTALALVAGRLGIDRGAVAAVGDWKNDREMIAWAGLGVVMPVADPSLLDHAEAILPADSDHDGVARWLEEVFPAYSSSSSETSSPASS